MILIFLSFGEQVNIINIGITIQLLANKKKTAKQNKYLEEKD